MALLNEDKMIGLVTKAHGFGDTVREVCQVPAAVVGTGDMCVGVIPAFSVVTNCRGSAAAKLVDMEGVDVVGGALATPMVVAPVRIGDKPVYITMTEAAVGGYLTVDYTYLGN